MKHLVYLKTAALFCLPMAIAQAQPPDAAPPALALPQPQVFDFKKWQREQAQEARHAPGTMLMHFAQSISSGDLEAAAGDVVGGENNAQLLRLQKMVQRQPRDWQLVASPLFEKPAGDAFTARVTTAMRFGDVLLGEDAQRMMQRFEQVDVRREGEEWKIVPRPQPPAAPRETADKIVPRPQPPAAPRETADDAAERTAIEEKLVAEARDENDGFLNQWARILIQPRDLTVRVTSQNSMNNVKQLMLGILQLAQDYDERFAFNADNFVEKVMPYVKSEQLFQRPILDDEKSSRYSLNAALFGKSMADLDQPARTVAVYEGGEGKGGLNYRFNGRAVVGYADGHVGLLSPEQTDDLVWKIGPKPSG